MSAPLEPPAYLAGTSRALWIAGRDYGLNGGLPHDAMGPNYGAGCRAASAHLEVIKLKPTADSSGPVSVTTSEPAKYADPRDDQYPALYLRVLEIEKRLSVSAPGSVPDHLALRILTTETQLASIADAVRQLSSRVSEVERQLRGIAAASNPEPDKQTAQRGIAAADPALELWAIAVDLNSAANRFREKHRHEWTFTDSTADSISRYAHKIESLSSNFQKPSAK